jgi:PPP family 3-phenylpropionic acid transporter
MTAHPRRTLVWVYAAAIGVNAGMPWNSLLLAELGLKPEEVARTLLLIPLSGLVGAPLLSWWADRYDTRAKALVFASGLAALACLGLLFSPTWATVAISLVALGASRGAQNPLIDATTMSVLGSDRHTYGRYRGAGTASFIVLALVAGYLQDLAPRGGWWLPALAACAAWGFVRRLPATPAGSQGASPWPLLRHPTLAPLGVVAFAHGITICSYHHLFALLVEHRGLAATTTGASMAVAAMVELAAFAASPWLTKRFGYRTLLLAGLASGVPRWWLTAHATTTTELVLAQAFHGLGYGAYWLAGVSLFARHAPAGLATSAQTLFSTATFVAGALAALGAASVGLSHVSLPMWFEGLAVLSALATVLAYFVLSSASD